MKNLIEYLNTAKEGEMYIFLGEKIKVLLNDTIKRKIKVQFNSKYFNDIQEINY